MKSEFWLERWENNQIGFHQEAINAHLQEYWSRLAVPEGGTVFVPLCGKTRDMLWLRAQGHPVIGVEISPVAVADFFRENDLEPEVTELGAFERWEADGLVIYMGDFFDLQAADLRDVAGVFDRASLIALPPHMRADYARTIHDITPAGVATLLVTMEYPQAEMDGPPFSVEPGEVDALYGAHYAIEPLFEADILDENPRFRERGLTRLCEKVYRLTPSSQ